MDEGELEELASTKRKGKPERVSPRKKTAAKKSGARQTARKRGAKSSR